MKKKFNITGICIPKRHYMVDISAKLKKIVNLIEDEEYFIINRPRQYGKTTTLYLLEEFLKKDENYLIISTSFEGVGDLIFKDEKSFSKGFMIILENSLRFENEELSVYISKYNEKINSIDELSYFVSMFIKKIDKNVVLIIDEVDKSSNNQMFLSFLGMLRNKYLLARVGKDYTFSSVILAGVHDVKNLKLKLRTEEERKYNSPWNIATDFKVDMSFSIEEIKTMLIQYMNEKKIKLDIVYFAERLRFYTAGYPFLVSKLCKIIDEEIMQEDDLEWQKEYLDLAVKELLKESNTNFDSLIKNIENNEELYNFVKRIVLDNEKIAYVKSDTIVDLATTYGILKEQDGVCKIDNKIYEQLIYDHMMMKVIRLDKKSLMSNYNYKEHFIDKNGDLNVRKILIRFSDFMRHEYSKERQGFLEADGRLVFLAFISPIINGTGFAFKEAQGGEGKRFDIVITYNKKMYIIELKIWNGEAYHKKGLLQLGEYLDQYKLNTGYLVTFDFRKELKEVENIKETVIEVNNKEKNIIEIYC